jgi:hypothetical protein
LLHHYIANDIATDITKGLALDKTAKPIVVDMDPIITAIDHNPIMHFLLLPFGFHTFS